MKANFTYFAQGILSLAIVFLCHTTFSQNLPVKVITDNGGAGTGTKTWSADTIYMLSGRVFVNPNDTLTIEAGTIIKGQLATTPETEAMLIVSVDAHIRALGTATSPIIFTSELDDVSDPDDIIDPASLAGSWGGVHLLGRACVNGAEDSAVVEGMTTPNSTPAETRRVAFGAVEGACDDSYNAGIFRYVSIRFAGALISLDTETDALLLAGIGSQTEFHHVEVGYTLDDGFAFLGGNVCGQYLMGAGTGDDAFDFDMGSRATLQFITAVMGGPHPGNRAIEVDGTFRPNNSISGPVGIPNIYNATLISLDSLGSRLLDIRDDAGIVLRNSVAFGFNRGVRIEIDDNGLSDSYAQYEDSNNIDITCNLFWRVAENDSAAILSAYGDVPADSTGQIIQEDIRQYLFSNQNQLANPLFTNPFSLDSLDLTPLPGSPLLNASCPLPPDVAACVVPTAYVGAFESSPSSNKTLGWAQGWTFMSEWYYPATTTTSIETPKAPSYSVFPNPANAFVQVKLSAEEQQVTLSLFDLQGRLLTQTRSPNLSLERVPAGVYLLSIEAAGTRIGNERLIIAR